MYIVLKMSYATWGKQKIEGKQKTTHKLPTLQAAEQIVNPQQNCFLDPGGTGHKRAMSLYSEFFIWEQKVHSTRGL